MKSSYFKTIATSLSFIATTFIIAGQLQAATDQNQTDNWSKATSAYKTATTWATTPNTSSGQQDSIPEIDQLKKRMGDFITQGMQEMQKKGYAEPQSEIRSDILEKDGAFYLLVDLPGMKKDQISIEVKGQEVLISGERKVEDEFKTSNLIKIERKYGNFQRLYSVPEEFIADQISAKFENGVLQVRIPKKVTAQVVKPKTITIS